MARELSNPVYLASPEKGVDGRTTLAKARAPVVTDGRIGDFFIDTVSKKLYGPKSAAGWPDNGLIKGDKGWAPVFAIVVDGNRRVQQIADWQGGEGPKPATGQYVGATGFVDDIGDAVDFRGPEGPEMSIDGLGAGGDTVTYDTLVPAAESADDNKSHVIKELFSAGGTITVRTTAEAQALVAPERIGYIVISDIGVIRQRVDSEPGSAGKHRSADRWLSGEQGSDSANGGWWEDVLSFAPPRVANSMAVTTTDGSAREEKTFAEVRKSLGTFETVADAVAGLTPTGTGSTIDEIRLSGIRSLGDEGDGAQYVKEDSDLGMPASAVIPAPGISKFFVLKKRTISAEMLQAYGNGVNVDDQAFEDMADYAGQLDGKVTFELPGAYKLNESHVFRHSNLLFDFRGRGLIDTSGASSVGRTDILRFEGPGLSFETTATASIAAKATSFPVADASGLRAGDFIVINSTGEYFCGITGASGFSVRFKGEISRIRSIAGNTLTLEHWTRDSYSTAGYTVRVRKLSMLENIKLCNGYMLGSGDGTNSSAVGSVALWADCVRGLNIENMEFENFRDTAVYSNIGWEHKAIGTRFHGRRLDDPSNLPNVSDWFTGWCIWGVHDAQLVGNSAKYVRRMGNPDTSLYGYLAAGNPQECVVARDIQFIGGISDSCYTGPGGHLYDGMTVVGHVARKVVHGIQHRGKNLMAIGCTLDAINAGVVLGVGSSEVTDPTTYTEEPSCGEVDIIGCNIKAAIRGILATSSWDRFKLESRIEAPQIGYFAGKRQSNFTCRPDWLGNGTQAAIMSDFIQKLEASRWIIKGGRMSGFTDGIVQKGTSSLQINDFIVDGVDFAACTGNLVQFGTGGSPLWGARLEVKNSRSDGAEARSVRNDYGATISQFANSWGFVDNNQTYIISSDAITIVHSSPISPILVDTQAAAATDDLATINGGAVGQIIVVRSLNGARDITVKHGTGNINLNGMADVVLSHPNDAIVLMKISSTSWASIAPLSNNAT